MNPNEVGNFNNYDDEGGNIAQNQTETLEFKNLEIDRYLRKLEELTLKLKEKEKLKEVESLQTEIFTKIDSIGDGSVYTSIGNKFNELVKKYDTPEKA